MATNTTNTWQLKFLDTNSEKVNFSFTHANPEASAAQVKNAMQTMITNNSIWQKNPATIDSAKLITRTTRDIDLS